MYSSPPTRSSGRKFSEDMNVDLSQQLVLAIKERDSARLARDLAHAASNELLLANRAQRELLAQARTLLAFSACTIRSGEDWSPTCELMFTNWYREYAAIIDGQATETR